MLRLATQTSMCRESLGAGTRYDFIPPTTLPSYVASALSWRNHQNEGKELSDNISWLTLGLSAFVEGLGCAPETQS